MSEKIIVCCYLILIVFYSCSSDNSIENDPNLKKRLLKSIDSGKDGKEEYEYENGYLTKVIPNVPGMIVTENYYEYNNKWNLIDSIVNKKQKTSYLYDAQDRLIKVIKEGTGDYSVLEYFPSKVLVTNHYETTFNEPKDLISEVYIDSNGKIIKTIQITPSNFSQYLVTDIKYDGNNNIIQIINSGNTNQEKDLIIEYEYDSKNNPQYVSYKYYNQSLYYWIFSTGNSIIAMSPNNIISIKGSTSSVIKQIKYNSDNFPINIIHSIYQGNSSIPLSERTITYDYYEWKDEKRDKISFIEISSIFSNVQNFEKIGAFHNPLYW